MLELWLICFDAMPGALGLTRTQSALLHACCLPLVLFLDVNKIILPDMNMFVFRLWRSWMSWNEFIAFVLTYNGCPCWETLSRPPTGIWPRFHAIDYIDQVSSQSSAVNRRATPLVSAGHGIYGMSSFFFWKSRQAWPNQPVTEHVWYATNSKRLSCPKKNIPTEKRANAWDLPPTILPNQLAKGHATTSASAEDVDCLDAFCGEGRSISAGFSWCLRCVYLAALGANLGACLFLVYSGPPNR